MITRKDVLIYGDSLTFGKIPGGLRYSADIRFTGVLQSSLGNGYAVLEEGLRGRTVKGENAFFPERDGLAQFGPIFGSHLPIDLLILFLGTNDTNSGSNKAAKEIALGFGEYKNKIEWWCAHLGFSVPKVVLVSPPSILEVEAEKVFGEIFKESAAIAADLPSEYKKLANELGFYFFDAASVVQPSKVDGVHLGEQENYDLGKALSAFVKSVF